MSRRLAGMLPKLGLLVVLAGCAATPGEQALSDGTFTSLSADAARSLLSERLEADGFAVMPEADEGFTVTSHDPRFQHCDAIPIRDRFAARAKSRLTRPELTTAEAQISIDAVDNGTQVTWMTQHIGSYVNHADNIRFDRPCTSSGELEELLASVLSS